MRLFLAGIMQGSHLGQVLHRQGYRPRLKQLLADHLPDAEVYDPLADHQDSVNQFPAVNLWRYSCSAFLICVAFSGPLRIRILRPAESSSSAGSA